uniref:Uncharacterized protein n=1 Tax=Avena sativa TaxID=4498 RepID=A0ACD5UG92_AVESA
MGEHAYDRSSMSPSTPAAQHKASPRHHHATAPSRTATTRPAIKIIHIVAPEIIKTDAANFRDLVQRLTGRQHQEPAAADEDDSKPVTTAAVVPTPPSPVEEKPRQKKRSPAAAVAPAEDFVVREENMRRKKIKCEVVKVEEGGFGFGGGGGDLDFGELWMDLNPEGFLSFLEEDVFQGTMAPDFLQPPLGPARRDLIGEMCASFLA